MEKIRLGRTGIMVPRIATGCMRINNLCDKELDAFISGAVERGLNFFDHADIYGKGECESLFKESVGRLGLKREDYLLQSKCGIVSGVMYDSSKEHILSSVDGSLRRLGTDYLDVLLIHRPDALSDPEEIAEAFELLKSSGKVRAFGVSNHRVSQIELLRRYGVEVDVDQIQFSLTESSLISYGFEANMNTQGSYDRDGGLLDYARLNDISLQAWSPFQYGFFEGCFIGSEKHGELNKELERLSEKYGATPTTIASAWIFRHPVRMSIVSGTTKLSRLEEIEKALSITLEKADWYSLYRKAGHILP